MSGSMIVSCMGRSSSYTSTLSSLSHRDSTTPAWLLSATLALSLSMALMFGTYGLLMGFVKCYIVLVSFCWPHYYIDKVMAWP
jgi:hypothetical protein